MSAEIEWITESALEFLVRLDADGLYFRTQLKELNLILSLTPGRIYEIDGDVGVGKTQICYSLAAKFLESKPTARIGWISAIPLRTDHLSNHFISSNDKIENFLERIVCKHVEKTPEFRKSLENFDQSPNLSLVFVEDVDALLHDTVYDKDVGRIIQTDILERIRKLTRSGITVVVTNHITHWRGYPSPALGAFWSSQIAHRFFVEKREESSDVRVISTMMDQKINEQQKTKKKQATNEIQFRIGSRGLEAAAENG